MILDKLPQYPPVLLLDEITICTKDFLQCRVEWTSKKFFHDKNGRFLHTAMPELLAQAAAALQIGLIDYSGCNHMGMLTALKNFCISAIPEGDEYLVVEVRLQRSIAHHQIVTGNIQQKDRLLAEGTLFLYHE